MPAYAIDEMDNILQLISSYTGAPGSPPLPSPPPPITPLHDVYGVLCFSKNRPFQLNALLDSLCSHLHTDTEPVVVLYDSSPIWDSAYDEVFSRYTHLSVTPVKQTVFERDFEECMRILAEDRRDGVIMFCVDDLVFESQVDMRSVTSFLRDTPDAYGVHLKLHPGVAYSHPGSCVCFPPTLKCRYNAQDSIGVLQFDLRSGTADWRYPFDLCAGVYRMRDIMQMLSIISSGNGEKRITDPNTLEVLGNQALWSLISPRSVGGCMMHPSAVVVTVNRVQEKFDVPVYDTPGGDIISLNSRITQGDAAQLDIDRYRHTLHFSVHIGDLYFLPSLPQTPDASATEVSVIIPVYNAANFLHACLDCLLKQEKCVFETIAVLNGCTDDSKEVILSYIEKFSARGMELRLLMIADKGLISALDAGLAAANAELVARLDADDILCDSLRLYTQLQFLRHNPNIHVVGTQALVRSLRIQGNEEGDKCQLLPLAVGIPTHPVHVHWSMLFRCCVLHPTVMMRRSEILEVGGYGGGRKECSYVEDYDLWCRMLARYPQCIANLPDASLILHRHSDSKSVTESRYAKEEALIVSSFLCSDTLLSTSPSDPKCQVKFIRNISCPKEVSSNDDLIRTCEFIRDIFGSYVSRLPEASLADGVMDVLRELKDRIGRKLISQYDGSDISFKSKCCEILELDTSSMLKFNMTEELLTAFESI